MGERAASGGTVGIGAGGGARAAARRFAGQRLAVAAAVVLALVVTLALAGGSLWRWDYDERDPLALSSPPTATHPLGTDDIGRDVVALVLQGARRSVQVAVVVATLSTALGAVVGAVAGYRRGWVDAVLMRLTDVALVIPGIAVFALLAGTSSGGWLPVAVVIAAFSWMPVARVVRGVVLSLGQEGYVEAARLFGAGPSRVIATHLLPNAAGPVVVSATVAVAVAILAEAGLSYLGLGIRPPDVSLGLLIDAGQQSVRTRPWLFYAPGAVIVVLGLAVNFVGEGLGRALDPRRSTPWHSPWRSAWDSPWRSGGRIESPTAPRDHQNGG